MFAHRGVRCFIHNVALLSFSLNRLRLLRPIQFRSRAVIYVDCAVIYVDCVIIDVDCTIIYVDYTIIDVDYTIIYVDCAVIYVDSVVIYVDYSVNVQVTTFPVRLFGKSPYVSGCKGR